MTNAPSISSPQPRWISAPMAHDVAVSVVSLVADEDRYATLRASFGARGFTEDTSEFIAIDNRGANRFDGFSALRRAVMEAKGRWVVFTHDDIELIDDGFDQLVAALKALEARDPNWMLAGNAGSERKGWRAKIVRHLSDPHKDSRIDRPRRVESLDENFLVMPRDRAVLGSIDLHGFHFYASDLSLVARVMGGRSYVIPFFLRHNSGGRLGHDFSAAEAAFTAKFRRFFPGRRFRTPSTRIRFGWRGLFDPRVQAPLTT